MPTNSFIKDGAFGPEATAAMGEAFDAACRELRETGQFEGLRELIARRILETARRGELDPARLKEDALSGLSIDGVTPSSTLLSYMQVHGAAMH